MHVCAHMHAQTLHTVVKGFTEVYTYNLLDSKDKALQMTEVTDYSYKGVT